MESAQASRRHTTDWTWLIARCWQQSAESAWAAMPFLRAELGCPRAAAAGGGRVRGVAAQLNGTWGELGAGTRPHVRLRHFRGS
jgi:hypothetical protein